MERRIMGKTGMEVSVLGFGGAEIGYESASPSDVEKLLGSALDAGLNVIDTAECYNNSEELIGQAVSHRRNDFFLFTKCGHAHGFDEPDWDIAMLEKSIDRSLKNLRTDCLDLIQLHTCSEEMLRQGDVIAVLQRARDAGKTRFIGYSGDRNDAKYAVECGAFDTLQTSLNIADQQPVDLYLGLAKERGMGVIAKRPIANAAWLAKPEPGSYSYAYYERLQKLDYPFLKQDNSIGVALRWTLSQPGVHTAIVGTKNPARWQQNAALLNAGPLSDAELQAIQARWKEVAVDDWTGQS
jgi:aryl-alcohol dehydrogenase-like predicted oxidoreductase